MVEENVEKRTRERSKTVIGKERERNGGGRRI